MPRSLGKAKVFGGISRENSWMIPGRPTCKLREQKMQSSEKEKHMNINKFGGLSRDWAGGKKFFTRFYGHTPCGGEKTR